jgi:hypothetical protein
MTMIPVLVAAGILLVALRYLTVSDKLNVTVCDSTAGLQKAYDNEEYNVEFETQELRTLGYDYIADGERIGGYYYAFIDGQCVLFLLNSDKEVLHDYKVSGRIMADNTVYSYILEQCAELMNMDVQQVKNFTFPYVISELDHTLSMYRIVRIFMLVLLAVFAYMLAECVLWIFVPWLHPQIRKQQSIGSSKRAIRELDRQIYEYAGLDRGSVVVTKRYLVINTLFNTDVIRLRDIEVISKHMEMRRTLTGKRYKVFKLIISNSANMFYEHEFRDEKLVDEIIPFLKKK